MVRKRAKSLIAARITRLDLIIRASFIIVILLVGKLAYDYYREYYLKIGTAGEVTDYYKFGEAFSKVVAHHSQIRMKVVETKGSRENIHKLEKREIDLAIVQNDVLADPVHDKYSVRAVASLFPEIFHLILPQQSTIKNIADLKGCRIAITPKEGGSYHLFLQIITHYGLTEKDFVHISFRSVEQLIAMFREGKVDAACLTFALGDDTIARLLRETKAYLMEFPQAAGMCISLPYLQVTSIPRGTYNGSPAIPADDIMTASVQSVLLSHESVDEQLIYEIMDILDQHHAELVSKYPFAAKIKFSPDKNDFSVPLHPGARNYYKRNEPSVLMEYGEMVSLMISLMVLGISEIWRFRLRLKGRQKKRSDEHNREILQLVRQVYGLKNLDDLYDTREKLLDIFAAIVKDLEENNISQEAFQTFMFSWEVATTTLHDQEDLLRSFSSEKDEKRSKTSRLRKRKARQETIEKHVHQREEQILQLFNDMEELDE